MYLVQQLIRVALVVCLALAFPVCQSIGLLLLEGAFTVKSAVKINFKTCSVRLDQDLLRRSRAMGDLDIEDEEQLVLYDDSLCTGKGVATPTATLGNLNFFDAVGGRDAREPVLGSPDN
jgi:hypothetical protein